MYYDMVTSLDQDLYDAIKPHMEEVSEHEPEHIRKIHQASVAAFLYLFLSLGSKSSPPSVYTLRSTIPIGAGLGSSASISVCLAASLLLQCRVLSGPHQDQPPDECALQVERINRWSFVAEMCIHGNPSGVDNTVASGGKAVLFQRSDYSRPPSVTRLNKFPELPLLLVNTRQSRSTATEVAKVGALRKAHPVIAAHVLDAINGITESAHSLITAPDFDADDPMTLQTLGELASVNHGLLVSLGVSHPKLERIRALIDHAGIGWTKLTGAGGGGCAITILKPDAEVDDLSSSSSSLTGATPDLKGAAKTVQPASSLATEQTADGSSQITDKIVSNGTIIPPVKATHKRTISRNPVLKRLSGTLGAEGFESFTTTLAGDGVGVLMPAVIKNGLSVEEDGEGGEEIDQEKFLRAEGIQGIERLVGVGAGAALGLGEREGVGGGRDGWKFWRY